MYHGGTNPEGLTTLNENQRTRATNHNDMPVVTYDFQAPLGEFGQTYPQYYMLRPLHLFMHDWGEELATMEASFPAPQDVKKGDDSQLRWAVRSSLPVKGGQEQGFIFVNNYERLQNLTAKKNVQLEACGVQLPKLTIPAGCMAIFPVNVSGIRYATAQLVARSGDNIYMMQIDGVPTTICMQDGKTLRNVKAQGGQKPVYKNIYLLTREEAEHWGLPKPEAVKSAVDVAFNKAGEAGPLRNITIGVQRVAEEPQDDDFARAAVYKIELPSSIGLFSHPILTIDYQGDCARLYADGTLTQDFDFDTDYSAGTAIVLIWAEATDVDKALEETQQTPSLSQAQRIKQESKEGKLTEESVRSIISEEKKPLYNSVTLSHDTLRKYFPKSYTVKQMEKVIIRLLDNWLKHRQQSQER